jgi:hypothetical protein
MLFRRHRWLAPLVGVLWLATVLGGMRLLWGYAEKPGAPAAAPREWPTGTRIPRADRPVLVMMAHPHCPCTRASLAELARLMARLEGKVDAYVVFLKPAGMVADWEKTDLWGRAAAIPGVTVLSDEGGREAGHFGAATSGQTLLYDAAGRLRFAGGITIARGHEGDGLGQALIRASIAEADGQPGVGSTAVYGCPLADPAGGGKGR